MSELKQGDLPAVELQNEKATPSIRFQLIDDKRSRRLRPRKVEDTRGARDLMREGAKVDEARALIWKHELVHVAFTRTNKRGSL